MNTYFHDTLNYVITSNMFFHTDFSNKERATRKNSSRFSWRPWTSVGILSCCWVSHKFVICHSRRKGEEVSTIQVDSSLQICFNVVIKNKKVVFVSRPLAYTRDGDAWVIDVGKYISESAFISKGFPLNSINQGISGYKNLSPSCKLRVLNFLCDETLSTEWVVSITFSKN